jgi:hypothetical protein
VLRYNAKKSTTETGEVSMLLVLDRSKPLRARLTQADAKRLAALLTSAADQQGDPQIKH